MKYITPKHLRKWNACYTDERIAELVPDEGLTLQGYLALDIPDKDKVWLATRPKVLSDYVLYNWTALIVGRALGRIGNPDPRSVAVIGYLRSRATGGPRNSEIVNAAVNAATHAAYAAAYAADATDAATHAAYAAAYAATDATDAATHAAAYAAAAADAADAERALQVKDLLGLLETESRLAIAQIQQNDAAQGDRL